MPITFGASFEKLPTRVKAVRHDEPFTVINRRGTLNGQAGDYEITNLNVGGTNIISPEELQAKYDPVSGENDVFETKKGQPVIVDITLPDTDVVVTREGVEKTVVADAIPSVLASRDGEKPYPIGFDKVLKLYKPAEGDSEAQTIAETVKAWLQSRV
jgi:hypothetical protein